MDVRSSAIATARSEPDRPTILDLAALIVGVAIVLVLPWSNRTEFLRWSGGWTSLNFYHMALEIAGEGFGKAALILVPVVLVRSARRCSTVRPAEFLLACLGLPWLAQGIHDLMMLAWMRRNHFPADMTGISLAASRRWNDLIRWPYFEAWLAVLITASVALVVGRKRLPGWLVSTLLMAAWLGANEIFVLHRWVWVQNVILNAILPANGTLRDIVGRVVVHLPYFLLFSVPAAAALLGRARAGYPGRSWLEWVGLGLATPTFMASLASRILGLRGSSPWPGPLVETLKYIAVLLLSVGLGAILVARFRPAWNRLFGVD